MTRTYAAADFDYDAPPERIAQRPAAERSASRLLVLDRAHSTTSHEPFGNFPALIRPGDVLVRNVTKVLRARLIGRREGGGSTELLLVHPEADGTWLAMVRPGGKLRPGRAVRFGDDATAEIVAVADQGLRRVRFHGLPVEAVMARYGAVPLPPYIDREADAADAERYQTVYATAPGSVAAPTAGLHFTPELLREVRARGATFADVTLHVGPGTFRPVEVDEPSRHRMHAEWYEIPAASAEAVNTARREGRRVWAIGTTSARVLETGGPADRRTGGPFVQAGSGWTDLFIYPPFEFRVVDALLTNFHLPRSTLLMLVAAFAGYEATMAAYREAVTQRYRLYSYGDAMAIV